MRSHLKEIGSQSDPRDDSAKQDDQGVGTAFAVMLVLLAVGVVINQLLRLRKWLKRPPGSRP